MVMTCESVVGEAIRAGIIMGRAQGEAIRAVRLIRRRGNSLLCDDVRVAAVVGLSASR